jgi:hypothetical protein
MFDDGFQLVTLLVGFFVGCAVLYFVIRAAVLSALRLHTKSPTGAPEHVAVGNRKPPEDPQNWG